MNKRKLVIELDDKLREEVATYALEMGMSVAEWCEAAIERQIMAQKSLEELSGQMGFSLQEMDMELMTDQLFSFFDDESVWDWKEIEKASNLILPEAKATIKDNE